MPTIRPSTDLRNSYNEISSFCHNNKEPVFITKNGHGDLAVMSIELYEKIMGKHELYMLLDEGLKDVKDGNVRPYKEVADEIRESLKNGNL